MREQDLHNAVDALKTIVQALDKEEKTSEKVQNALSEVFLFLSNTRLNHSIDDLMPEEDMVLEDGLNQMLNAVNHASVPVEDIAARIQLHLDFGEMMYAVGRWDQAMGRFEEALTLSEDHETIDGQARALRHIGRLKRRRGHWKSARQVLKRAAKICRELGDVAGEADAHLNLGNIDFEQGNYKRAEKAFRCALEHCQKLDSEVMSGNVNLSLGTIQQVRGRVGDAIEHYTASLGAYEAAGDHRRMAQAYLNLGISYRDYNDWVRSGMSFEQGLALARKNKDLGLVGMIYLRRAESQAMLSDTTMAMMYGRRAMRIFIRMGDPLGQADTYRLYGQAASIRGAWHQSMDYLTESTRLHQTYHCPLGESEVTKTWAELYEAMGDRDQALSYYEKALQMFQTLGAEKDEQQVLFAIENLKISA